MNDYDLLERIYIPPVHMDRMEHQKHKQILSRMEQERDRLQEEIERAQKEASESLQKEQPNGNEDDLRGSTQPATAEGQKRELTPLEKALLNRLGPQEGPTGT